MKSMLIMSSLAALVLSACSNEKHAIQNAIDQDLSAHPVCVRFGNNQVTFPLQLGGDLHSNSILDVLDEEGLIELKVKNQDLQAPPAGGTLNFYGKLTTLDLTPKGREKNVWNPETGFCIGARKVVSVEKWTAPTASDGLQTTVANYTWQVDDLLFGIRRSDFPNLAGMGKPKPANALLKKMNDGWDVMKNDAY